MRLAGWLVTEKINGVEETTEVIEMEAALLETVEDGSGVRTLPKVELDKRWDEVGKVAVKWIVEEIEDDALTEVCCDGMSDEVMNDWMMGLDWTEADTAAEVENLVDVVDWRRFVDLGFSLKTFFVLMLGGNGGEGLWNFFSSIVLVEVITLTTSADST